MDSENSCPGFGHWIINCLLLPEMISDRFNIKSAGLCYSEPQGLC